MKNRIKFLFLNEVSIGYDIHFYQPKTNKHGVNHLGQLLNNHLQITTIEDIPGQEEGESIHTDCFHRILCYGDQLTVERIRGAQAVRLNSENGIMQLRGFFPAVTNWHAKVSFLGVSYYNNSVLFSTTLF